MTALAQTALQPEAIGVLVVLAVALVALAVVGVALLRSRRRRAEREAVLRADAPRPERFDDNTVEEVLAAADAALYAREARDVTEAALWLSARSHPQAMPYLLHALRTAPAHHRAPLLRAAAAQSPDELAQHPLLAAAIDPSVLASLRDAIGAAQSATRARSDSSAAD